MPTAAVQTSPYASIIEKYTLAPTAPAPAVAVSQRFPVRYVCVRACVSVARLTWTRSWQPVETVLSPGAEPERADLLAFLASVPLLQVGHSRPACCLCDTPCVDGVYLTRRGVYLYTHHFVRAVLCASCDRGSILSALADPRPLPLLHSLSIWARSNRSPAPCAPQQYALQEHSPTLGGV